MKKIILLFIVAAGLLACNKEQTVNPIKDIETPEDVISTPITFDINIDETKASKTGWVNGDVVNVFFKGLGTKYLKLVRNGTKWDQSCPGGTITDSDLNGLAEKQLSVIYFPVEVEISYADNKFSFTSGGKKIYQFYNCFSNRTYTLTGSTVSASITLNRAPGMVQFHIAGIQSNVSDYTFACKGICPRACVNIDITSGSFTTEDLPYGARLYGIADSDGGIFSGYLESTSAIDYDFIVSSTSNVYTLSRASKALSSGKMYNFPALSETGGANWSVQDVSSMYEDLGLSVKWAKCNLDATEETGYGNFYSWGDIRTKSNFGKYYYRWNADLPEKYNSTDALTTLQPEDDAAYAALGGNWRLPTISEWNELVLNCTWVWQADHEGTGIAGYLVTSNKSGYETKSIFLPAGGWSESNTPKGVGSLGYYWSSSVNSGTIIWAKYLTISSGEHSMGSAASRYYGYKIRPVCE